jgi:FMNH2-dependent dimethyl sulfone monooxygenase
VKFGVWTPLPHILRPEPRMDEAIRESGTYGMVHGPDKAFRFAVDMLTRAEELGFETTLIAERWLGTDHPAWILTSALAALTRKVELMVAVHLGFMNRVVLGKFVV